MFVATKYECPETPVKRPRRWTRSLWIRALFVTSLVCGLAWIVYWIPRRSVCAVCAVGGKIDSNQEEIDIRRLLANIPLVGQTIAKPNWQWQFLYRDNRVTVARLVDSGVDDRWIARLSRFANLEILNLDCGQIGPGLQQLAKLPRLDHVGVAGDQRNGARNRIGRSSSKFSGADLLWLPQIRVLTLYGFQAGAISGLSALKRHETLRVIELIDVASLADVLNQLEGCENIETLVLNITECDDEMFSSLRRLSYLTRLEVYCSDHSETLHSRLKDALPTAVIAWQP